MTAFVFLLRNKTVSELCTDYPKTFKLPVWKGSQSEMVKDMLAIDAIQWRLTGEFAKFLIQTAELWMFVPAKLVDGVWVVLEEPLFYKQWLEHEHNYPYADWAHIQCKEYQEAKKRLLFEGFTYHIGLDKNNPDFWFVRNSSHKIHDYELETAKLPLENFVNLNYQILLTSTAQKQIGL